MKALSEMLGFAMTDLVAGALTALVILWIGIQSPFIAIVLALVTSAILAYIFHLILL